MNSVRTISSLVARTQPLSIQLCQRLQQPSLFKNAVISSSLIVQRSFFVSTRGGLLKKAGAKKIRDEDIPVLDDDASEAESGRGGKGGKKSAQFNKKKGEYEDEDDEDDNSGSSGGSSSTVSFDEASYKKKMEDALESLRRDFSNIRTGRVVPTMLDHISIVTPAGTSQLPKLAQVSVKGPRVLGINVFDKALLPNVERSIRESDLGLNPVVENQMLTVPIPKLTQELRANLSKLASKHCEQSKVRVRNVRKEGNDVLKKIESTISKDDKKRFEKQLQTMTDGYIVKLDEMLAAKEKDIKEN